MSEANFSTERREFFRRLGRRAVGAATVALTGVLLLRNGSATTVPACSGGGRCGRCDLAEACGLPAAARRRARRREGCDA